MAKWSILLTDGLAENGQKILRQEALVENAAGITADDLLKVMGDFDAMIVRGRTKVTSAVFDATNKLQVVGRAGVGVDNIDLAAAAAHGVKVVNSPTAATIAVAEHALALMLALARMIPKADAAMKAGKWAKKELRGSELYGKTLGIVGMGRIGSAVGQRAAAFGMTVIGFDAYLSGDQIRASGAEPVSLKGLYTRSDYISFHVPLTDETRGMVNARSMNAMKSGVRLVCTARGGVIDETALLLALESGKVSGVALDVFAQEPPGKTELVAHPKVVVTPHIGAQTEEAQKRTAVDIATEVLSALKGKPLRWRVA